MEAVQKTGLSDPLDEDNKGGGVEDIRTGKSWLAHKGVNHMGEMKPSVSPLYHKANLKVCTLHQYTTTQQIFVIFCETQKRTEKIEILK